MTEIAPCPICGETEKHAPHSITGHRPSISPVSPLAQPATAREAILYRLQACARKYPDFPEASIWLADLDRVEAEAAAPQPAEVALREAAITIEGVLQGMDWLGTGSSQRAADNEQSAAWKAWSVILTALGDSRDPVERVWKDANDPGPLASQPAAEGLDPDTNMPWQPEAEPWGH